MILLKDTGLTYERFDENNPYHQLIRERAIKWASPQYRPDNFLISKQKIIGTQIYYHATYFCYLKPEFCPGVQGRNEADFWFDNDMEDASLKSSTL